jgi:hypothetical protein
MTKIEIAKEIRYLTGQLASSKSLAQSKFIEAKLVELKAQLSA